MMIITAYAYALYTYSSAGMGVLYNLSLRTEAGIDAPRPTTPGNELCIEVRIHLNQQSGPTSLSLQIQNIRPAISVERTTFYVEAAALW